MAINSLLMVFSVFVTILSVRFFLSKNVFACKNSISFLICLHFHYTNTHQVTHPSNETDRRPLSFKFFLAFSTHLSVGVHFTFTAYLFAAALISHSFFRVFFLVQPRQQKLSISARNIYQLLKLASYRMSWSKI